MKGKKLTPLQEAFVREYLVDLNATKAAERAGYSLKTAYSTGHENLKKPEIARRINEAKLKRQEKIELTSDRVLQELMNIAFSSAADFYEKVEVLDEETGDVKHYYNQLRSDVLDSPKIAAITNFEPTRFGHKPKMADKMKALEMISKHLGLFNADTSQKPENTTVNDLAGLSSKKLRELQKVWKSDDSE